MRTSGGGGERQGGGKGTAKADPQSDFYFTPVHVRTSHSWFSEFWSQLNSSAPCGDEIISSSHWRERGKNRGGLKLDICFKAGTRIWDNRHICQKVERCCNYNHADLRFKPSDDLWTRNDPALPSHLMTGIPRIPCPLQRNLHRPPKTPDSGLILAHFPEVLRPFTTYCMYGPLWPLGKHQKSLPLLPVDQIKWCQRSSATNSCSPGCGRAGSSSSREPHIQLGSPTASARISAKKKKMSLLFSADINWSWPGP